MRISDWSSDVCSSDLEILFGFTVAGFISVFVPEVFWDTLFIGAGGGQGLAFLAVLENAAVAPIVAFFTFIGSMGNVPLAAMLWSKGNSFGGVMARSEEHTSELQSLMRISYAVFCLKKKKYKTKNNDIKRTFIHYYYV